MAQLSKTEMIAGMAAIPDCATFDVAAGCRHVAMATVRHDVALFGAALGGRGQKADS